MSPKFAEECLEILVITILMSLAVIAFFKVLYWLVVS
jgi:hypothetical protein